MNLILKLFYKIFILFNLCFFYSSLLFSQNQILTGTITDEFGTPLLGAKVLVKGTIKGAYSDVEGKFQLELDEIDQILIASNIGYKTQEVTIAGKTSIKIELVSSLSLDEVIVTALGVRREEKALGYSVQKIDADQITTVKATNIANALAGKVSGVYITGGASGPTASANINIRGAASLLGNNQPLFVLNGIPISNELFSFDDGLNGSTSIDFGNAAQIVNPDDIASISVLKGPAASALYGSRAADGVILIETLTGSDSDGWGVSFNTSTTFENVLKLPDYQNEYGFGGGGKYSYKDGSNYIGSGEYYEAYGENWGPRLNGQLIKQFNSNGEATPFTPAKDNIRNFFRTGITSINNVALANSTEDSDMRLSYTNMTKQGIVPNTDLKRNTFNVNIGRGLLDNKLKARLNAMYINSASDNVPNAGYDESSSIMYGWLWYPRQVATEDLMDYWQPGLEGTQQRYVENLWVNNPWFIVNENTNAFQSNRLIGNFDLEYEIIPRFTARLRYGADILNDGRQYRRAPSTKAVLQGSYREDEISFMESNAELLLSYQTDLTNPLSFNIKAGGNIMRQDANFLVANNPQLKFFGTDESIYTLTNSRSGVLVESQKTQRGINSVFCLSIFLLQKLCIP